MNVELSKEDARLLRSALRLHLKELQIELVRTENQTYRKALKNDIERLEVILGLFHEEAETNRIAV